MDSTELFLVAFMLSSGFGHKTAKVIICISAALKKFQRDADKTKILEKTKRDRV